VYSTCSLDDSQNEEIVQWLLDKNPNAELLNAYESVLSSLSLEGSSIAKRDEIIKPDENVLISESSSKLATEIAAEIFSCSEERLVEIIHILEQSEIDLIESVSVEVCKKICLSRTPLIQQGKLPGTCRLDRSSGTSGLFFAKIGKATSALS
jgi:hypothetical protein